MIEHPWPGFGPQKNFALSLARGDWVLGVNRARHAGDGYASADMELWDVDDGGASRLVAYATQTMLFSFAK